MKKHLFIAYIALLCATLFAAGDSLETEWKKGAKFEVSLSEKLEMDYGGGDKLTSSLTSKTAVEVLDVKGNEIQMKVSLLSFKRSGEKEIDSEKLEGDAQKKMFSLVKEKGLLVTISKSEIKQIKNIDEYSKEAASGDENVAAMLALQYEPVFRSMMKWLIFISSAGSKSGGKNLSERIGEKWSVTLKAHSLTVVYQEVDITYDVTLKEVKAESAELTYTLKSVKSEEVKEAKGSGSLQFDLKNKRPSKFSLEQSFKFDGEVEKQNVTLELSEPKK
ncbi:MAG: hypothetical protein N2234_05960 [Planctomycetota bacterium]|nr:hypothetical protein [Planctomycetota bacterium]